MEVARKLALKPSIMIGTLVAIALSCMIGCASMTKTGNKNLIDNPVNTSSLIYVPLYIEKPTPQAPYQKRRPTGRVGRLERTIDTSITPRLDRLYNVVERQSAVMDKQSKTIAALTAVIQSIRGRSTKRIDSLEGRLGRSLELNERLQQITSNNEANRVTDNANQIKKLNNIVNLIMVGIGIIVTALVVLWLMVRRMWKTIKKRYVDL